MSALEPHQAHTGAVLVHVAIVSDFVCEVALFGIEYLDSMMSFIYSRSYTLTFTSVAFSELKGEGFDEHISFRP